jgi:hypothetical protein
MLATVGERMPDVEAVNAVSHRARHGFILGKSRISDEAGDRLRAFAAQGQHD